jgi:hypothetical protein
MGGDGMGQGRPRSPCLYKYHPNTEEKGGKKRTAENREGNRESETDSVERERTETVEIENRGYRQGDRERQTEKRKKKGQKE